MEVIEHHQAVWEGREHKWALGARSALRLATAEVRLLARRPREDFDVVIVGYPGHLDLTAARRAARGRPVVLNPLVSLSDTFVADRGRFYDRAGAVRDVVQNHMLQVLATVTADPPDGHGLATWVDAKSRVVSALGALTPEDCVRGQYEGYRDVPGVDRDCGRRGRRRGRTRRRGAGGA